MEEQVLGFPEQLLMSFNQNDRLVLVLKLRLLFDVGTFSEDLERRLLLLGVAFFPI